MVEDATISSITLGRGTPRLDDPQRPRPTLFLTIACDAPLGQPSRHLLDDVDEIVFGRGERSFSRHERRLTLRVPDRRMSTQHARLIRSRGAWMLEDLASKNGCIVNGTLAERALIAPGDVFELGHTFFLYREVPALNTAADDTLAAALPAPTPNLATFVALLERSFASLARIAGTTVSVVILGETGTGKEVVARALHELSSREGPFMAVNCGALPETLLEAELFGYRKGAFSGAVADRPGLIRSADLGTLFLDEVAELPASSQVAFLRVLQEQEVVPVGDVRAVKVDTRLCAATHRDLDALVEAGTFRRDLYARLFGLVLDLPPLRERREDMGILIGSLLGRMTGGDRVTFSPVAMRALLRHDWPLNIRELDKCLAAAVALAGDGPIDIDHLPGAVRRSPGGRGVKPITTPPGMPSLPTPPQPMAVPRLTAERLSSEPGEGDGPLTPAEEQLRARLVDALTVHEGNVTAVAKAFGKGRMQIHRWARRFGLQLEVFRRPGSPT